MAQRVLDAPRLDKEVAGLLLRQPKGAGLTGVARVASKLWRALGTPVALRLAEALKRGDVDTVANATVDPRDYDSPLAYFKDVQAASFLRKADFLAEMGESSLDPEKAALSSFYKAELRCRATNVRLEKFMRGRNLSRNVVVPKILEDARRFIKSVLPPVPKVHQIDVRFGPGATSRCSGDAVTIADKLAAFPEVTPGSRHLIDVVKNSPTWFRLVAAVHPGCLYKPCYITDDFGDSVLVISRSQIAPRLTRGNRFVMVNKTAKTKRGIAVEPHTLSCIQLAVGSILADVLRSIGLQKDVAQDVHGRLAMEASISGDLCTVDLEAASDSVALMLVRLLFPWDWFVFLSSLRSEETYIEGRWVTLEKFSSMGNGFTFELETLIFYALARAVSNRVDGPLSRPVAVFGDDMICSSRSYLLLKRVLGFCGFAINPSKTFVGCGFNESCGRDYFNGTAVRPYFLKEEPTCVTDWYGVANGVMRIALLIGEGVVLPEFRRVWLAAVDNIPPSLRFYGPSNLGDAVIHSSETERWSIVPSRTGTVKIKHRSIVDGKLVTTTVNCPADDQIRRVHAITPVVKKRSMRRWCDETIYTALLYALSSGGLIDCQTGYFSLRGEPEAFRISKLAA